MLRVHWLFYHRLEVDVIWVSLVNEERLGLRALLMSVKYCKIAWFGDTVQY